MPIQLLRQDITRVKADAIVNAANRKLLPGGGVCGAIHAAAGPALAEECSKLGGCKTGEAKITGAYALPAKFVIHTVGPVWQGGLFGEEAALKACYRNSLALAEAHGCKSIAFPLISSGIFGYPQKKALSAAVNAISDFLLRSEEDLEVYLVLFGKDSFTAGEKLFPGIKAFIDDRYAELHEDAYDRRRREEPFIGAAFPAPMPCARAMEAPPDFVPTECSDASLESVLEDLDESFSQMVLRKIAEKGMKNADCYKKANLDKKLFSKIKGDIHYKPKKPTALALAVALELSLPETRELLQKAGYALSRSEKFDVIVEYFLTQGNYDVFEINEALFFYDQPLLGGAIL